MESTSAATRCAIEHRLSRREIERFLADAEAARWHEEPARQMGRGDAIRTANLGLGGFFSAPVRISFDDRPLVDAGVLRITHGPLARADADWWITVPLVLLAASGERALADGGAGRIVLAVPGAGRAGLALHFATAGDVTTLSGETAPAGRAPGRVVTSVRIERTAIQAAWASFAGDVRDVLLAAVPELADHVRYGRWFALSDGERPAGESSPGR